MSLIIPHRLALGPQQHKSIPYLWRISCSCGWQTMTGNRGDAVAKFNEHVEAEEPFPDDLLLDLGFDPKGEPGSGEKP